MKHRRLAALFLAIVCVVSLLGVSRTGYMRAYAAGPLTFKFCVGGMTVTKCDPEATGKVVIPDKVDGYSIVGIDSRAFQYCMGVTEVTIPNTVKTIGICAFYCAGLTTLTIPDSVTTISNQAFQNCQRLTTVTIGSGVTTIDNYAFSDCTSLETVYYHGNRAQWEALDVPSDNYSLWDARIVYKSFAGDLDASGKLNEDDAIYLLQHVLMPDQFPIGQTADYDRSGKLSEDDAIYLLQHVLMPDVFPLR